MAHDAATMAFVADAFASSSDAVVAGEAVDGLPQAIWRVGTWAESRRTVAADRGRSGRGVGTWTV